MANMLWELLLSLKSIIILVLRVIHHVIRLVVPCDTDGVARPIVASTSGVDVELAVPLPTAASRCTAARRHTAARRLIAARRTAEHVGVAPIIHNEQPFAYTSHPWQ